MGINFIREKEFQITKMGWGIPQPPLRRRGNSSRGNAWNEKKDERGDIEDWLWSLLVMGSHLNFYTRHKWRKYLLHCANSRDGYLQVLVQCSDYMIWVRENCLGNVKTSFFQRQSCLFIPTAIGSTLAICKRYALNLCSSLLHSPACDFCHVDALF
jgi:hypothetical protein